MAATKKKATKKPVRAKPQGRVMSVYFQTNKNVAPYVHKHLGVRARVMPGEDPRKVLAATARFVHEQLGLPPPEMSAITIKTAVGENTQKSLIERSQESDDDEYYSDFDYAFLRDIGDK